MNWFLIGISAPFLWAITNFIDKFIIDRYYKGVKIGFVILSFTLLGFLAAPIPFILANDIEKFSFAEVICLFLSGAFYTIALLPYMKALTTRDTSLIIPIFQLIPIFALVLGVIFLDEKIELVQILLGLIIIFCSIAISIDITKGLLKFSLDRKALFFMTLSCLIYSIGQLFFKLGARNHPFWDSMFWMHIGYGLQFLIALLFWKKAYIETKELLIKFRSKIVIISVINTSLDIIAKIAFNFALYSVPLFLASIVNSFQPVFVFLIGICITLLWPQFIKEDLSRRVLVQKVILIILISIATVAFNYSLE